MTYLAMLRGAVCCGALTLANGAMADITAAQVWDDWKQQLTLSGSGTITTSAEDQIGDTLIVRDLALRFADQDVSVLAQLGDLQFTQQGDGSVSITMAESYPITITGADGVVVTFDVTQAGLELLVSGSSDDLRYDLRADRYGFALRDIVDGNVTITGDIRVTANDLTGSYQSTSAALRNLRYDTSAASVDILVDFQIPGSAGEYIAIGGKMTGLALQADITLPDDASLMGTDDAFGAGLAMAGGYTLDRGEYVYDINAEGDQASGAITTGTGSLTAQISSNVIAYRTQTRDLTWQMMSPALPMPLDLALGEYGIAVEIPMARTETAQPFQLGIDLVDLAVNDGIWDMIDPAAILPRDPASVQIALSGLAQPLFDFFDPAQADAIAASDLPFALEQVSLDTLNITAAGASVTGAGGFTFDNDDMVSFAPLPRPMGEVSVTINGLNALLDRLIDMGLIPADQMMAPRMMLGMFARSTGDDQLQSTLTVTPDGEVLANGQRIR